MHLIVGLGNPGQQYAATRHNAGFMMLDYLAAEHKLAFIDSKWKALVVKAVLWNEPVILLKPETFMNLSGVAVAGAAKFYKLQPADIVVIHDDLDLESGRLKMVPGGGDGGHKGIRSIIDHLGTKDFPRIKIGIGRPPVPVAPDKYVLGRFDATEKVLIEQRMAVVSEAVRLFLQQGIAVAMNLINHKETQDIL